MKTRHKTQQGRRKKFNLLAKKKVLKNLYMSKSCRIIVESLEHETRLNRIHEYKRFQQMLTRFGYWRRRKLIIPITTDE